MGVGYRHNLKLVSCLATLLSTAGHTSAESISAALSRAYKFNLDLGQQRAGARAADEDAAIAKSALRPSVTGSGIIGVNKTRQSGSPVTSAIDAGTDRSLVDAAVIPGTAFIPTGTFNARTLSSQARLGVRQRVFDGNRSANTLRQVESRVFAAREQIRVTEQAVLRDGAAAYMDVLRDTAVVDLERNNILVLEEQSRQTGYRLDVGKVTPTDVAQANSSLARARSRYYAAQAKLQTSMATFSRIIGTVPRRLEAARPIDALLPRTLEEAVAVAMRDHPLINRALDDVDAAELQVRIEEAALLPTVDVVGDVQGANAFQGIPGDSLSNGGLYGRMRAPIYTGGADFAKVRQAKELVAQARLRVDQQRDAIRASVVSGWYALRSSKEIIRSSLAAVDASERALQNVRDEAEAERRTVLDVLIAQQALLQSRVALVTAERDRVVGGYDLLASIGRLSAATLGLSVVLDDPTIHYDQVKDKWFGLRTPDGR